MDAAVVHVDGLPMAVIVHPDALVTFAKRQLVMLSNSPGFGMDTANVGDDVAAYRLPGKDGMVME